MSDELDKASVRELGRTLDAIRQRQDALLEENRVLRKQGEMREAVVTNAIKLNTAAITDHDKRINAFFKLVREVLGEERKVVGAITASVKSIDDSVKIATQKAEQADEITGQHIKLRWSTIGAGLAKYGPLAAKVFGLLAAGAGAAWAVLSRLAHRL